MLLTFLMQVLSQGEQLNSSLLLSALKLIELISIVAMEEFHVY